jgi:hypothetical protein
VTDKGLKWSQYAVIHPLWMVLELGPDFLHHEIDRASREFGFVQAGQRADSFGPVMVQITFRQSFTWADED